MISEELSVITSSDDSSAEDKKEDEMSICTDELLTPQSSKSFQAL